MFKFLILAAFIVVGAARSKCKPICVTPRQNETNQTHIIYYDCVRIKDEFNDFFKILVILAFASFILFHMYEMCCL